MPSGSVLDALRCCTAAPLPGERVHQPRFADRLRDAASVPLYVCAPCAHTCLGVARVRLVTSRASEPFICCCAVVGRGCFWCDDPATGRLDASERDFVRAAWEMERSAVLKVHGSAPDPTRSYVDAHRAVAPNVKRQREVDREQHPATPMVPPPAPNCNLQFISGAGRLTPGATMAPEPRIQRPPRRESSGLGLANCGNTCYAASVLQLVVFRTPTVRSALLNQRRRDPTDNALVKLMSGSATLSCLAALLPEWQLTRQQDPHEFWQCLVEHRAPAWAHATLTVRLRGTLRGVACGHCWPRQLLRESMPIPLQPPSNVDTSAGALPVKVSALVGYFMRTVVEGGRCDNPSCRCETSMEQSLVFTGAPPPHLFVCVLRFSRRLQRHTVLLDDGTTVETQSHDPVKQAYPIVADRLLLPFVAAENAGDSAYTEAAYEASGFTEHHGTSLNCGHHTAVVREQDGEWYLYDDATVSRVDRSDPRVADVAGDAADARGRTEPYLIRYSLAN